MPQYCNFTRHSILRLSLYWMYGRDNAVAIRQHFGKSNASFFKEEDFFCYLEYRSSKVSLLLNTYWTTRQHVPEHEFEDPIYKTIYIYIYMYIISQTLNVKFQSEGRDMGLCQSKSVALYTDYSLLLKET